MWRASRFLCFALIVAVLPAGRAAAGAFLLPEGQGQFIGGVGYVASSRRFDATGTAMPVRTYRKVEASGYLEYAALCSKLTNYAK